MMPPFFTWSLSRARAAVVPWVPTTSSPMASRTRATESPTAGVGARDKSTIPNSTPRRSLAICPTNCPTRVILKAVFLTVSANTSKLAPGTFSMARWTTPGPETPTLMTTSASPTPWKAPAIKGLSSTALAKITSLPGPIGSAWDASLMIRPISRTAVILVPVLVDPILTEEQTKSVSARARGMELMRISSPFW